VKLVIVIRQFLEDVRSGYTDRELMEKYKIGERELRIVFRKLAEKHLVMPYQVPAIRPEQFEETIVFDKAPKFGE
jgi:hypothetical protein